MRVRNAVAATLATTALAVTAGCSAGTPEAADIALAADAGSDPLDILITNDDGWDAPGIQATYEALTEAGYDVTMAAPVTNQSGESAGFDFTGEVTVQTHNGDPNMHSVSASPVGSMMFGLNELLADDPPDLVVSGTNVGSNIGADTNYSGTVGAAVVAAGVYRIPAIAISTATTRDASGQHGAYQQTADLLVDILDDGIPDISAGTVLNINYPTLADGATAPNGYVYAPMSDKSQAAIGYEKIDDTTYKLKPARSGATPEPGTDWAELNAGNVTFTLLSANRTVTGAEADGIKDLVAGLGDRPESSPDSGSAGSLFGSAS